MKTYRIFFATLCCNVGTTVSSVKSIYLINGLIKQKTKDAAIIVNLQSEYDKNAVLKSITDFRRQKVIRLHLGTLGQILKAKFKYTKI